MKQTTSIVYYYTASITCCRQLTETRSPRGRYIHYRIRYVAMVMYVVSQFTIQCETYDTGHDPFHDNGHDPFHDTGHDPSHDTGHGPFHDTGHDPFHDTGLEVS